MENKRIQREKKTVEKMLKIYCRKKHHSQNVFCADCQALINYAHLRLDQCKFGEYKPTCSKCPIHCYKSDQQRKMIDVMKFSGPKMFFRHPWAALYHLVDGFKSRR